ncbi:hypothetical protein Acy02nite_39630 [Actinoplanes cyaneus]|uniref:Uncharacterized protein n=1 Tax=Actinoplanes cyaneus TaxID=52696 RepID=A0A919M4X5_9ACTN|nr:hypothetical protein [Actinoplanes cyaneus]MCW2139549.1 hypothetical protein [Actinoplanes cyaneus]GID66082.1 hypothetical protein Acy02nite_39630 [Actinoplanes cyaneus]
MANEEQDQPTQDPIPVRRGRRRKQALVAVAGAAVAISGAAFFAGNHSSENQQAGRAEPLASPSASASAGATASAPAEQIGKITAAGDKEAKGKPEPSLPQSAKDRVDAARKAAAKDGVKITHPLPAKEDPAKQAAAAQAKEVTVGSAKAGGAMRIVTLRGDLSGQREIGWVAGGITKHGPTSCSQRFKLYNEQTPKERPSLLVCWRTSAKRSVVVADTKIGGRPDVGRSLAVIDREWRKLG